jgi:copper chaperone CopZ
LIGFTVAILGFAWYQKLRPQPVVDECGCAVNEKPKFIQSKTFLLIITLFAALMITFPSYAKVFYPKTETQVVVIDHTTVHTIELNIQGMSCKACEEHVNHEVNKLAGIIKTETSYKNNNAVVQFDESKTKIESIINAVNSTGYKVIDHSVTE